MFFSLVGNDVTDKKERGMANEDLVRIGEAARILGRGAETLLRWEKNGRLPRALRERTTNNRVWPRGVREALAAELRPPINV